MNALCRNCRGIGNPWSFRQLRRWSMSYTLGIIFLSETMIRKNDVEALKFQLGYKNTFGVASIGKAGG